ncbi:hypothetical protein [Mycobacteroides abscessus]|uniref:hypothetical protein n=1 Tax=Mycobacteroides abscessus TaxID=36809 RepID=UPI000C25F61C|nr:hypothetical protein [Mycobacteroides abscessus]
MGFLFESDVDRRRREAREEWQAREDIKYARRLESDARREEGAQQREAQRAARARAAERKRDREKMAAEYAKQEQAARPPITERVGGTRGVKVVTVSHYKSPIPVAFLPPHESGHKLVSAVEVFAARGKRVSVDDAETARALFAEVERDYGSLLSQLRNESWWDSLCDAAGVTLTRDGKPRPWTGRYASGVQKVTLVHSPTIIAVRVAADGLRIKVKARIGDSPAKWGTPAKLDLLRSALMAQGAPARDLTVSSDNGGNIILRFRDRDPLAEPLPQVIHPYDEERGRSYVGQAEDGSDVFVTWKNNASALVAGMQGSGKTASLMPMVAGLAGKVELHIVDCGSSGEWEIFAPVCKTYDDSGDLAAVERVMQYALDSAKERMASVRRTGHINFWDASLTERRSVRLQHMVIIVEEAPVALSSGQTTAGDREQAEKNMSLAGRAVKTVRKAGITIIFVAQKPAATEIPSIVRDMCGQRLCFRLDSDTAAQTALGDAAFTEPKPTSIPAGTAGRFVGRVDTRGSVLAQAVYVPIDGIREHINAVKRTAPPVPANAGRGASDTAPTPEEVAAMTDEERQEWMHRHAIEQGWVPVDTKPPTSGKPETPETEDTDDGTEGDF